MPQDDRPQLYADLHHKQLRSQEDSNRHSARTLLSLLREFLPFQSILDVGCGLGTWLRAAQELGISDLRGVEGPWLNRSTLVIPDSLVLTADLQSPIALDRAFDLVLCLEVGEHLPAAAAPQLISSLTSHAKAVLFSAAIPFQGGHDHVNEQFPPYWVELFARHEYAVVDLVRPRIWEDESILWWLRQNTLLFVHRSLLEMHPRLKTESEIKRPLSVVLPDIWSRNISEAHRCIAEHKRFGDYLNQGGTFEIHKMPDGRTAVRKL